MIIDSNLVFLDCTEIASGNSDEVALNYLKIPGKMEPIPVCFKVLGDPTGVTKIVAKLEEADKQGGTYTAVQGGEFELSTTKGNLAEGKASVFRFVPPATAKPWLRLALTVTGSASASPAPALFAGVMREDEITYEAGMYIDKGVVVG